jgi:hypothetical protein
VIGKDAGVTVSGSYDNVIVIAIPVGSAVKAAKPSASFKVAVKGSPVRVKLEFPSNARPALPSKAVIDKFVLLTGTFNPEDPHNSVPQVSDPHPVLICSCLNSRR